MTYKVLTILNKGISIVDTNNLNQLGIKSGIKTGTLLWKVSVLAIVLALLSHLFSSVGIHKQVSFLARGTIYLPVEDTNKLNQLGIKSGIKHGTHLHVWKGCPLAIVLALLPHLNLYMYINKFLFQ